MPKYLFQGSYRVEGLRGLLRDGGTKRREVVEQLVTQQGGRLEAFYYAYGGDDFFIIADMPDGVTTSAVSLAVNATGAVSFKTIVLITPEEVDGAVKKSISYRPRDSKVNANTEAASEGTGPLRPETIRRGSVPLTPLWKIS